MSTGMSPETEAFIRQALEEGRYRTREALLDTAVRLLKDHEPVPASENGEATLSDEQWLTEFNAWIASHDDIDVVADDSRDSIYSGRDE